MSNEATQIEEALDRVRAVTEAQLPLLSLPERTIEPESLPRFSPTLPDTLSTEEQERLRAEIKRLSPWLQGPFYLGGRLIIEGIWRNDGRWASLGDHVPDLTDKRVLDVGSNAGYDPFMFHMLGAREVLACEPFEFIAQAQFLESVYQTGVDFQRIGWQRLDPEIHGLFDVVHCNGVLYHEPNPMGMLQRLRTMVADGGELLLGSMMLEDPTLAEYTRFVRHDYAGDPTWWWVPGRLALRRMVDAAGFDVEPLPFLFGGPAGAFGVCNGYVRGRPTEPDPELVITPAIRE
jgi:tRNA (mo5U34)-methyltransferase